jgi:hypothetical protein
MLVKADNLWQYKLIFIRWDVPGTPNSSSAEKEE